MKVTLQTHGGLAGGLRLGRPPVVVDAGRLSEADANALAALVSAVRTEPPVASARAVPDAMSYTVTVEDGGRSEVLRGSDASMSDAWAELVTWVDRHGRADPPGTLG